MDAHETKIYTAVLIVSITVGTIIFYFIVSIVRQQRKNAELYHSKMEAEINAQEKERKRIASDLHDELGPLLSAVKLKISSVEAPTMDDRILITESEEHIDRIMQRMREIANDLMPHSLLRKGIAIGIQEFVEDISRFTSMKIIFNHQPIHSISENQAVHLYRIIQEIIHNAVKHSEASRLLMSLYSENGKNILLIEDDGKGFDFQKIFAEQDGHGLRNISSRADILEGDLFFESEPGTGTRIRLEIPANG